MQCSSYCRLVSNGVHRLSPSSDAPHINDKMPLNFVFVGLIHLALPQARFIHICPKPLDTSMSCFSLLFTGSQSFACDLGQARALLPRL
jgi:hypothetical protein